MYSNELVSTEINSFSVHMYKCVCLTVTHPALRITVLRHPNIQHLGFTGSYLLCFKKINSNQLTPLNVTAFELKKYEKFASLDHI